jgi:hypothetical protein
VFIGLLLVVLGVYLGVQMSSAFLYLGVGFGLLSCAWGVRILLRRMRKPGETNVATESSTLE